MEEVFRIFFDLRNLKLNHDDDSTDRISRLFSAVLIIILATIVSARQCLGEAIHCWCPEVCATNHEKYANLMCWVDDTYYVPFLDRIPHPEDARLKRITYYQWVPIILMFQAILFLTPWFIWRILAGKSGIHLGSIVESASKSQLSAKEDDRDVALRFAVYLLDRFLIHRKRSPSSSSCHLSSCQSRHQSQCCQRKPRISLLFLSYLFIKILYLLNAIGQIFLLDKFLGVEFYTFGYHVLAFLLFNKQWTPTDRFPHVTLCDFRIRQSTNVHQYTVQCVLPINIFNEKVFAVIWFWLVAVSILTFFSLFKWLWSIMLSESVFRFVKQKLDMLGMYSIEEKVEYQSLRIFANSYLGRDGLFALKLVAENAGEVVAAEVTCNLWMHFRHTTTLATNNFPTTSRFIDLRAKRSKKKNRIVIPDINNHAHVDDV